MIVCTCCVDRLNASSLTPLLPHWLPSPGDIQFENECDYVDASVEQFVAWKDGLKSSSSSPSTPEPTSGKKLKLEHECSSSSSSSDDDPFEGYDIDECWAYADYKYMIELARLSATQQVTANTKKLHLIDECFLFEYMLFCICKCIDWSAFGFEMRNASDSTLWLATRGAYTPCHYDSYGYNLVAQIFGT